MSENKVLILPLRDHVTLVRCLPDSDPITESTAYRPVSRETFRQLRFFSRGSTCLAYEATDEAGNRRVLTEFCPLQQSLQMHMRRSADQELIFESSSPITRYAYQTQRLQFIQKWKTQRDRQADDRLLGNNGPELYFLGQNPFLVMHYDGTPLLDFSDTPVPDLLHAMRQVCAAIHQEHEAGLLLNDIKPDNLLFTGQGDTILFRRLLDYGSALPLEQVRSMNPQYDMVLSSKQYWAPEIRSRSYGSVTYAADVYSLGKTVLNLLCGLDPALTLNSLQRFRSFIEKSAPANAPIRKLRAADPDTFFSRLYAFAAYTISEPVMPDSHVYDWQTDPFRIGPEGRMRLRSMADVKRLLEGLEQAARPPAAIDLGLALRNARQKARLFEKQGYGNSQEWELEQRLFSDELLISYRAQDGTLFTPDDLLQLKGCAFLEGISGCGKSVGLRYLYKRMTDTSDAFSGDGVRLPVYIPLEKLAASGMDLDRYIARELFGDRASDPRALNTARTWLRTGGDPHLVLLCDGINEIPATGNSVTLVGALNDLTDAARDGKLTVVYSGQNHTTELKSFLGQVLTAQPLDWYTVTTYFYARFPHAAGDPAIEQRLENLRNVLTTAQRVHDLCVPHINKTRIHPNALPQNETRLLHDYIHAWSAKEKIHKAVCGSTAYSSGQESGEPYGELLIDELAQLCWTMALRGDHYISQRNLLSQLETSMHPNNDPSATLGCSYLTDAEERQVMSLLWTGVLFDLEGNEMHIRHESYRDYLAAEYLAKMCNQYTESGFPTALMMPIPDPVLRHVLPMLTGDALQRICSRIKAASLDRAWKAIANYALDRERRRENMSDLHDDDLSQAARTMSRLVLASGLSRRAKWRTLRRMGHHFITLLAWRDPL